MWEKELSISGYEGQAIKNWMAGKNENSPHLCIVIPGYENSVQHAPIHYSAELLLEESADVLRIGQTYSDSDLLSRPEEVREKWIREDAESVLAAGLAEREYERITLIGMSIGTLAMGHMLQRINTYEIDCIWLSPLLNQAQLAASIQAKKPRSLFVFGAQDRLLREPLPLDRVNGLEGTDQLILNGVGHSLEMSGDVEQSLSALMAIIYAVRKFISS